MIEIVVVFIAPTDTTSDWLVPVMTILKSSTSSNSESVSPLTEIQLVPIVVGIGPGAISILVSANEKSSGSGGNVTRNIPGNHYSIQTHRGTIIVHIDSIAGRAS